MVVIHQNQYQVYLENCERRLQAMRAIRSLSNAGLDWFKHARRNSKSEMDPNRRMSSHVEEPETKSNIGSKETPNEKSNNDQNETTHERL